jgi:hypothetical protein
MRRLAYLSAVVSLLGVAGCGEYRDPSMPPFRIAPYGPGLELGSNGRPVHWTDGADASVATFRASHDAVRVYAPDAVRVGRLLASSAGYRLVDREGSETCRVMVHDGSGQGAITCADGFRLDVERMSEGLVIRNGSGASVATLRRDAEGSGLWVEQEQSRTRVDAEGSGVWSVTAADDGPVVARVTTSRDGASWAAAVALDSAWLGDDLLVRGAVGWLVARLDAVRQAD